MPALQTQWSDLLISVMMVKKTCSSSFVSLVLPLTSCLFLLVNCSEYRHPIHWDTVWVGSGRVERNYGHIEIPREHTLYSSARLHDHSHRRKRMVYGSDDRVRIDPSTQGSQPPYNSVVKVSTGCSGILISPKYVLAASHCVHDGNNYLLGARLFLRAGYMQSDGRTKWTFVKKFFVPVNWTKHTSDNPAQHQYSAWADYDYSVLELAEEMDSSREHILPGLSGLFCNNHKSIHGIGSTTEFVSFPDDKPRDAMWLVSTKITTETSRLLYFEGDAWHGSSGAALYAWDENPNTNEMERRVIGVLSGNRETESEASIQGKYNVAIRLNPLNLLTVCKWSGIEDDCRERYKEYLNESQLQSTICNPRRR